VKDGRIKRTVVQLTDLAAGSRSQWYRRLLPLYGSGESGRLEKAIDQERRKALKRYGVCLGAALILCGACLLDFSGKDGEKTLFLEYEGVRQEIQVKGAAKKTQDNGRKESGETVDEEGVFAEVQNRISREMLGNNESWDRVSGPLVFPQRTESGVFLRYETDNPRRISAEGAVDGIGAGDGEEVMIQVTMLLGNSVSRFSLCATVIPPRTEEEKIQALRLRADYVKASLSKMSEEEVLAEERREGIRIGEKSRSGGLGIAVLAVIVLTALSFFGRFQEAERRAANRRRSLEEKLPLLMEQLILMMNAGLILSEALRTAAEAFPETEQGEEGQLFRDIRMLCQRAEQTRRPVTALLCDYAVETGVPELVRFSTMLADHVSRGSASLVRQLKTERGYAMERQWKQKEGRCREMEVRLAGPLFLLLAVILILATGPVWIGM